MIFNASDFVVYEHIYEGVCIYIGSGSMLRAFDFKRDLYENIDLKLLQVKIIKFFPNRKDAYDFETEYSLSKKDIEGYNLLNKAFGYKRFGENNPMFGKSHSEETRTKISKSHIGKKLDEEVKEKIKKSNIGKHAGSKNSQAIKIKVINLVDNSERIFGNMREAAKEIGVSYPCVKSYSRREVPYGDFLMKRI